MSNQYQGVEFGTSDEETALEAGQLNLAYLI